MERFWEKVEKVRPDGCWLWMASTVQGSGYGQFRVGNKVRKAHVVAYELMVGPVPDGLTLDHLCSVRRCVNPSHLEPVTMKENLRRAPTAVSTINAAKTHCARGHEFTAANVYPYRGRRYCRACQKLRRVADS